MGSVSINLDPEAEVMNLKPRAASKIMNYSLEQEQSHEFKSILESTP